MEDRSHNFQLFFNARDKQPWSHWKAVNVMGKQYDACIVIKHKSGLIFIYFLNINFIIHSISFSIIYLFSFKNCYCININNFVYLCNPFIVIVDWKVILDYLHSHYLCKFVSFSFSMWRGWFGLAWTWSRSFLLSISIISRDFIYLQCDLWLPGYFERDCYPADRVLSDLHCNAIP